jgi:hypothetical protein
MLKQLTFYGKQTQASHIRKDLWQPFAAVTCPTPEFGMNVYQRLREYRHVRDYSWTFRPTPEDIEETLEKAMETRETPKFDNRLPTLKERAKLLMDQKASSIADLADVIRREAEITRSKKAHLDWKAREQEKKKAWQWEQIANLAAKAREGELAKYEGYITRRTAEIEAASTEKSKARGKKGLMVLKIKRNELLRAKEAFDFIEDTVEVPLVQRLKWNQQLCTMVQARTEKLVNPEKPPVVTKETKPPMEKAPKIPTQKIFHKGEMIEHSVPPSLHPSNARIDPRLEPYIRESRGLEPDSILIQWRNVDDAFYAAEWPKQVVHELVRKELLASGNRFTEDRVPESAFPGNENIVSAEAEADPKAADIEEAAEAKEKAAEEERKNSFMGKFRDTVKAPFGMQNIQPDSQEARK